MKGRCKNYGEEFDCCKILSDFSNPMTELKPCAGGDCKYYMPETNFDRITESAESLAEFFATYGISCVSFGDKCDRGKHCKEYIQEWLQKEADDGI